MANFAKIGLNNTVTGTMIVDNYDIMDKDGVQHENLGVEFLKRLTGHETWLQYSFNVRGGIHYKNGTDEPSGKPAFRKNSPDIGWTYNQELDAFVQPKPSNFPSWVLNEETCLWEPPVPKPEVENPNMLAWDEENVKWIIKVQEGFWNNGNPKYVLPE